MPSTSNTSSASTRALSHHRIRTIMKSSSEAENVGEAAIKMMCKATEMFLKKLTRDGHKVMKRNEKELDYKHLAEAVKRRTEYDFLKEMMPRKITMREFKELDARRLSSDDESRSSSEEEEEEDNEQEEEEEESEDEDGSEEEASSSGEESKSE